MNDKIIFLSHIHEEKDLAVVIKQALEDEFSGFVDVFVSSDGTSVPAGSNFLKRIEDGLILCVGALYLISPSSVRRSWINFELGAVWIRSAINIRQGMPEIPTLPICHSDMTPTSLPPPLNNLNAIVASQASQLEFAFRSLQTAVGGKGRLKSDFDAIGKEISEIERRYTVGNHLVELLHRIVPDDSRAMLVDRCSNIHLEDIHFQTEVENNLLPYLEDMQNNKLKGHFSMVAEPSRAWVDLEGTVHLSKLNAVIKVADVLKFKDEILAPARKGS